MVGLFASLCSFNASSYSRLLIFSLLQPCLIYICISWIHILKFWPTIHQTRNVWRQIFKGVRKTKCGHLSEYHIMYLLNKLKQQIRDRQVKQQENDGLYTKEGGFRRNKLLECFSCQIEETAKFSLFLLVSIWFCFISFHTLSKILSAWKFLLEKLKCRFS